MAVWLVLSAFGIVAAETADSLPPDAKLDSTAAFVATALAAVVTGAVVADRRPNHPVGWMLLIYGMGGAVGNASFGLAAILADDGMRTAAAWFEGVSAALYTAVFLMIPGTVLLFPSGRLPSPRWRPAGLAMASAAVVGFVAALLNGGFGGDAEDAIFGPVVPERHANLVDAISTLFFALLVLSVLGAVASLIVRFRRTKGDDHQQMKWVAGAALFLAVTVLVTMLTAGAGTASGWVEILLAVGLASIPTAMGFAILKYRLYDIDVVISKSVTYLGLAAVITAVFAAVVAIPTLIIGESDGENPGLLLPIVATAIVAVLFEPVRSRLQRWANGLVYGERSTPHEVLSELTSQLSETGHRGGTEDLARLLAEGTGADNAAVWLQAGHILVREGAWPNDEQEGMSVSAGDLVSDECSLVTPVLHGEEVLGALSLTKPRNDPLTPADRQLVADVAGEAGLMLRNIGLNRQLEERAEQVRKSRQRLIEAQDAERHRLERDLHDGAQQQVVALKVKLGLAKTLADRAGADDVVSLISGLADEAQHAVDALRAVAHGIYPPLLESMGLEAALRAVERASLTPLAIDMDGLSRYDRHLEQAIYFCVLDTVERVHMSGATNARVGVTDTDGELVVQIDHDGRVTEADLTAVSDRVYAYGGTTELEALAGGSVRITNTLPTGAAEMVPA